MKKRIIFIFLIFITRLLFCEEIINMTIGGVNLNLYKKNLKYVEGILCNATLSEDVTIYGQKYYKDTGFYIGFNENISEIFLSKETEIKVGKNIFKAVGTIYLREQKISSATLSEDIFLLVNEEKVFFKAGHNLRFDLSGDLIVKAVNISNQNVLFFLKHEFNNDTIKYYPSGMVKSGRLAETTIFKIKDQNVAFMDYIRFYESGAVKFGQIGETIFKIKNQNIKLRGTIEFYESGNVLSGNMSEATVINVAGKNMKFSGGWPSFYDSGNFKSGFLAEEIIFTVGKHTLIFSSEKPMTGIQEDVTFYESGKVKSGYLYKDISRTLKKYDFVFPGRLLTFTEVGELDIEATTKTNLGHK